MSQDQPTPQTPGTASSHPRYQLAEDLAHPVRFSMAAALAATDETEFAVLRDHLQVSDSVLSRQASALEAAGIVRIRKGYIGKRPRTWLSLSKDGRATWTRHLAALQAIASGS